MRIAIADDDRAILEQISAGLEHAGHDTEKFRNGTDVQTALKRETFDVVLLDWNMPGMTGLEVIVWAQEALDQKPPFILLTSRQDKQDVIRGLEMGAVDYIVKPEDDDIIRARVETAARQTTAPIEAEPRQEEFGNIKLDRREKSVTMAGNPVHLTAKEFDLLNLFLSNLDRPLSRGYLFSQVWGGAANLETRTLDMHVSRLRTKLQLKPENGFVIRTVFGFGYRMDEYVDSPVEG